MFSESDDKQAGSIRARRKEIDFANFFGFDQMAGYLNYPSEWFPMFVSQG
jgi:hypothetical protein